MYVCSQKTKLTVRPFACMKKEPNKKLTNSIEYIKFSAGSEWDKPFCWEIDCVLRMNHLIFAYKIIACLRFLISQFHYEGGGAGSTWNPLIWAYPTFEICSYECRMFHVLCWFFHFPYQLPHSHLISMTLFELSQLNDYKYFNEMSDKALRVHHAKCMNMMHEHEQRFFDWNFLCLLIARN